ncbi:MAG: RpiB/LacA/LacB family sugar-phosphate isomerase [Candidatus Paceibacterota bacterium]
MTIHLASDHAGFEMKNSLLGFVNEELGFEVKDHGAHEYNEEDDFPDFVIPAAKAVASSEDMAIVFGGSGQGEAIAANRIAGVRAAVYYGGNEEIVTLSRQHNDANLLSIGARFVNFDEAKRVMRLWLETKSDSNEKYHRRNSKIDQM